MCSAAATLSGESVMVMALASATGATRRAPRATRIRSAACRGSALDRKIVFTTCWSYSLRLFALSGTTVTTFEPTTAWKVRPTWASARSASVKGTSRRSRSTGVSWNWGSKMKLTPTALPRAR
jgi:hypothetical protein